MKLRIFTDGACSGNPGPGGWAALFTHKDGHEFISGHELETTNNRMELLAVVSALETEEKKNKTYDRVFDRIQIHADSAYVVNAVQKNWVWSWSAKGWKTSTGNDVKNRDLWERLLSVMIRMNKRDAAIEFVKVKGHAGNLFNEMVDEKAREESNIAKKKVEVR